MRGHEEEVAVKEAGENASKEARKNVCKEAGKSASCRG